MTSLTDTKVAVVNLENRILNIGLLFKSLHELLACFLGSSTYNRLMDDYERRHDNFTDVLKNVEKFEVILQEFKEDLDKWVIEILNLIWKSEGHSIQHRLNCIKHLQQKI